MEENKKLLLSYILNEFLEGSDQEIDYNTSLISSGYVDSFSMVSLLAYIENQFKVKIPNNEATPEAFDTIDSIAALITKYSN